MKKNEKKDEGSSSGRYQPRQCPKNYSKQCPKKADHCLDPGQEPPFCPRKPTDFKEAIKPKPPMCPKEDPCYEPPPPPPPPYNPDFCPVKETVVGPCARAKKPSTPKGHNDRDCDPSNDSGPCGK